MSGLQAEHLDRSLRVRVRGMLGWGPAQPQHFQSSDYALSALLHIKAHSHSYMANLRHGAFNRTVQVTWPVSVGDRIWTQVA